MLYITGDTHGGYDRKDFPIFLKSLKQNDVIIVAGDFGYVWADNTEENLATLSKLTKGTIAFIDGNHENFDRLNSYKKTKWQGGEVHQLRKNIYHLMRGEHYNINSVSICTLGGAKSIDKHLRVEGETWWREEVPIEDEVFYFMENVHRYRPDIIITHEAPYDVKWSGVPVSHYILPVAISQVKIWSKAYFFCGHHHINKQLDKLYMVYDEYYSIQKQNNKVKIQLINSGKNILG